MTKERGPSMIISGGQTGVDRAALDVAIELGIPHGGWCPKGRRAEDGPIDARYNLFETSDRGYQTRTIQNVRDSHGTLILTHERTPGSALTELHCRKRKRPCLWVNLDAVADAMPGAMAAAVCMWIESHGIERLNVAGSRESGCPGIYEEARVFLREVLR